MASLTGDEKVKKALNFAPRPGQERMNEESASFRKEEKELSLSLSLSADRMVSGNCNDDHNQGWKEEGEEEREQVEVVVALSVLVMPSTLRVTMEVTAWMANWQTGEHEASSIKHQASRTEDEASIRLGKSEGEASRRAIVHQVIHEISAVDQVSGCDSTQ